MLKSTLSTISAAEPRYYFRVGKKWFLEEKGIFYDQA